eukprot:157186_1
MFLVLLIVLAMRRYPPCFDCCLRHWPMAQAKLTLVDNAINCLSPPSYARARHSTTFIAPEIDFEAMSTDLECGELDDTEWERGCCLTMGSKVNDKFDIQCFDELTTYCSKWFHSSCLSTKFKVKKRDINSMANTLDAIDWTCPICNDSKSDCDDNKEDEDIDMEEYSDENTNNSNTNTPRRNSSNSSNSARLTRRNKR